MSSASSPGSSAGASSSALISEVLKFCELSTADYPLPLEKWIDCLRMLPNSKALFLIRFEIFMDTAPPSPVVKATFGKLGHQFNIATVRLPDGRETHIRVDYREAPLPGHESRMDISLSDDHAALTENSRLISRLTAPAPAAAEKAGPSVAVFTSLLTVAYKRHLSRPYSVSGHNCFWMTDMLFYTVAKRYASHWLAGDPRPRPQLRKYLHGEAGVLETAVACATQNEGARRFAMWTGNTVRRMQVWATRKREDKIMMHDDEVVQWIEKWMSWIE